jgi:hypothetical protein
MVKRDRLRTNLDKLCKAKNDPKVLWALANSTLGKSQSSLPVSLVINGISTVGNAEAAAAMNNFYIEKVEKLRADLCPQVNHKGVLQNPKSVSVGRKSNSVRSARSDAVPSDQQAAPGMQRDMGPTSSDWPNST